MQKRNKVCKEIDGLVGYRKLSVMLRILKNIRQRQKTPFGGYSTSA
jgi:hypothetical protein